MGFPLFHLIVNPRLHLVTLTLTADLSEEAAKMLDDIVIRLVPKHLINEYNIFVLQTTNGLLSDVIDQCIKKGILNTPENKLCAEGTWMIVEK